MLARQRRKSEGNLSLTAGLKVLHNEYGPAQRTEVLSGFIGKEHFDKSHSWVGEVV